MERALENLSLSSPSDYDGKIGGKTTIFGMAIVPGSTVYRYDVTIVKNPEDPRKLKELTKQNDPGMRSAQRKCCSEILDTLFTMTQGFGVQCKFVYDGKQILYTTKEIKLPRQITRITSASLPPSTAVFTRRSDVDVTIMPNESAPKLDYSNLAPALVEDVTEQADRSVRMFLELLTSQYLINSNQYQFVSAGCLFDNSVESRDLVEGMQLRVGFKKGVRVGGTHKDPQALLVLDMKRTAFFSTKKVSVIYGEFVRGPNDMAGQRRFEHFLKGVRVVVSYDTSRSFVFGRLTRFAVSHRDYAVNGRPIPQFMEEEKKIKLQLPNIPGVHPDQPGGQKIVYPLECIEILHGQLVPLEKLTNRASQRLLAENSVSPSDRYTYVSQQAKMISTGNSADFMKHFGVTISSDNKVDIHRRNLPKIQVGGKVITTLPNGSWFKESVEAKFIIPSVRLTKWVVAYDKGIHENNVRNYIGGLRRSAISAGMNPPEPMAYRPVTIDQLDALFAEFKDKLQFIFYVDDERNQSHGRLKLLESYYQILTQHVITKNMAGGAQTLKNVSMKLNTKSFGLCYLPVVDPTIANYAVDLKDLLIIGIDLTHPAKPSPKEKFDLKKVDMTLTNKHPTVVGVSANKMANGLGFAGDFFYQKSDRDAVDPERLKVAVTQLVEMSKKYERIPHRVIVFRDGLSEGQQATAVLNEIPAIRAGIRAVHPSLDPKITFVVGTKDHHKRVFRFDGKAISNTATGDIVDSKIVRRDVPEFYQQSHNPLKGVPKMLQVATLQNELGMQLSDIQKLILNLSNMHQVSACPTSLPLPIYLSKETAKRGMDIYKELYDLKFPRFNKNAPENPIAREFRAANEMFDFDQLTRSLGYAGKKLAATRFNA